MRGSAHKSTGLVHKILLIRSKTLVSVGLLLCIDTTLKRDLLTQRICESEINQLKFGTRSLLLFQLRHIEFVHITVITIASARLTARHRKQRSCYNQHIYLLRFHISSPDNRNSPIAFSSMFLYEYDDTTSPSLINSISGNDPRVIRTKTSLSIRLSVKRSECDIS